MTSFASRRWILTVSVLFLLLALPGYRSRAQDAPPEATSTAEANATAEGTPFTVDVNFGSGPFSLPSPTVGLSTLTSYRATLTLSFKGTKAGKPTTWGRTYTMIFSQKPAARQLTIDTAGNTNAQIFMAEVNGARYERQGQDSCSASVADKDNSLADAWEPAGFLTGVIGADEAGKETVNGVSANHYTFDESAFGQQGIAESKGELWVAEDGGFIVKYSLATTGNADYFGEDAEGTITWDYELTDVNQPDVVILPADCPAGLVDAPLLPDATGVFRAPGVLTYHTKASITDVAAFYTKQIPSLGWQASASSSIAETTARLAFTQDTQQLTVIVSAADGNTGVQIFLAPASS